MQALVYIFIALAAVFIGGLAYFGLTFTPANAVLAALVFGCICIVFLERKLRRRSEGRLERAIEELSRLLATDAQAGAVLGQRINALTQVNPGERLNTIEADISVLGTVIRQVAEAVSDMEDKVAKVQPTPAYNTVGTPPPAPPVLEPEPIIAVDAVRAAIQENRLLHHVQPIVRLPQRRAASFDLSPRLALDNNALAVPADFIPRRNGNDVLRQIEFTGLQEAINIARRSRTGGLPAMLNVPLSRATLGDEVSAEQLLVTVEGNRAVAGALTFLMNEHEWFDLSSRERGFVEAIARKGCAFSVANMRSLRVDINEMAELGVRSVRVDATQLIDSPQTYTDFHISDLPAYLNRYDVSLIATNVADERQVVELLDNQILLVQGDSLVKSGPVRNDLSVSGSRNFRAV